MEIEDLLLPSSLWVILVTGSLLFLSRAIMTGGNLRRAGQLCSLTTPTPPRF